MSISPRTSKFGGMPAFFSFSFGIDNRDRTYRADIQGDVFAGRAVATRDASDQLPAFVSQSQRHAIELQFADVLDIFAASQFMHPALPVAKFFLVVGVVERQHGRGMRHFDKSLTWLATHALGGRVGSDQLGIARFELLQLVISWSNSASRDFGLIQYVVAMFVVADFFAQGFDFDGNIFNGGHAKGNYIGGAWGSLLAVLALPRLAALSGRTRRPSLHKR